MSLIVEFVFPSPHDSGEDGGRNGTHGPKLATGEPGRTLPLSPKSRSGTKLGRTARTRRSSGAGPGEADGTDRGGT